MRCFSFKINFTKNFQSLPGLFRPNTAPEKPAEPWKGLNLVKRAVVSTTYQDGASERRLHRNLFLNCYVPGHDQPSINAYKKATAQECATALFVPLL
ncbi:hypothetical protein CL634_04565 [bacterium]|nr:hypothetical protein [bacterium]